MCDFIQFFRRVRALGSRSASAPTHPHDAKKKKNRALGRRLQQCHAADIFATTHPTVPVGKVFMNENLGHNEWSNDETRNLNVAPVSSRSLAQLPRRHVVRRRSHSISLPVVPSSVVVDDSRNDRLLFAPHRASYTAIFLF